VITSCSGVDDTWRCVVVSVRSESSGLSPLPKSHGLEYICLQRFGLHKVFVLLVFLETTHFDALLLLGCCYLASGNARETEDAGFCVISLPKF
jgi:hypothetical protein